MKLRTLLALLAVVLGAWPAAVQDYERGVQAYKAEDYAVALKELRPLAEQGHVGAQGHLGHMYLSGLGVAQDFKTAAVPGTSGLQSKATPRPRVLWAFSMMVALASQKTTWKL